MILKAVKNIHNINYAEQKKIMKQFAIITLFLDISYWNIPIDGETQFFITNV